MKRIDIPMISDLVFYSAAAWFLAIGILRYYRVELWIAALTATLISLAVGGVVFLLLFGSKRKRTLTKKEREKQEALLLHLALEREERVRASLVEALAADGREAHCEGDDVSVEGKRAVPLFTMEPVSADSVARFIRAYGKEFTLLCNKLSPEAEKLLTSFSISVMRGDEIFALFERTGKTPDPLVCGEIPRKTRKERRRAMFSAKNARPFFVSGALLLLMSLFTFFPIYYIISGTTLLICAVATRLIGSKS